jgi:hypothetical protein
LLIIFQAANPSEAAKAHVVSYVDLLRNHKQTGLIADRKYEVKEILDSENWDRPDCQALMGTEPSNQGRKWTDFWRELLQCVSEEEIRHGVSRVVGVRWLPEHDALLFRVCLLRSTLRLPYDVVPRVRDVPPLCDDALLLFLTSVSSHRLP